MTKRLRIAHVIQNLNYGGMERVLHTIARALPAQGFEIHVLALQYFGHFAEGLEDCATLHLVPAMSRLSMVRPGRLISLLRDLSPDLVHCHSGVWFKAATAARAAGVQRVVFTDHGRPTPVPPLERLIDNLASRQTDAVIAVSDALADLLRQQVVHSPGIVRTIANGVDIPPLSTGAQRETLRADMGLPSDAVVIGSVGRLEPVKNYELAIRAFAVLARRGALTRSPILVIVGDGTERTSLIALAEQLGVSSMVKFLGWRTDANRLYEAFDVFTLTSRSEGTSLSLLEAMSRSICPVVTDVGGNRAVLGAELADLLVPTQDEARLASAWTELLTDPDRRTRYGALARERVSRAYSSDRMLHQHAALYRDLLRDVLSS